MKANKCQGKAGGAFTKQRLDVGVNAQEAPGTKDLAGVSDSLGRGHLYTGRTEKVRGREG